MDAKYIFVTGGVVSGLGKGITAATLGRLLKARGYKVTIQKFDPYLNIDPGRMSPFQHGEVFVTEDGAETDLDVGHYERFIDENLNANSNITTGKVYWSVLNKERNGEYEGRTVQVIPHITNEIKDKVFRARKATGADFIITEIGGTVGDIEGEPFYEAIRQVSHEVGRENVVYIHVTLVPYLSKSGEIKTKPTQHSVKELLSRGIQPDIVVCRTEKSLGKENREKIALFCNIDVDCVVENIDQESLYAVTLYLEKENLAKNVCKKLKLEEKTPDLSEWITIMEKEKIIKNYVNIAIIGKYVELYDAYLSIIESLKHAGIHTNTEISIKWINSERFEKTNAEYLLNEVDGIIVPGGFGERGVEGKINAIKYARENNIPFLGIGLGMQCAVIEFARNVANLKGAATTEVDKTAIYPVIDTMDLKNQGNDAMRLGAQPCKVLKDTVAYSIYNEDLIYERHRNKYEFNNQYKEVLSNAGLVFSGVTSDDLLVEIIELPKETHQWFIGIQFHPEFKSRPNRPHPIFKSFIENIITKDK